MLHFTRWNKAMDSRRGTAPLVFLVGVSVCVLPSTALAAGITVRLVSPTVPSSGTPGITHVAVIGTDFPKGVITSPNVTISLAPVQLGGCSTASTNPISATRIEDRTWRFVFVIPTSSSVSAATSYLAQVSGSYSDGRVFSSGNSASLTPIRNAGAHVPAAWWRWAS
jgi:hypothetical protein